MNIINLKGLFNSVVCLDRSPSFAIPPHFALALKVLLNTTQKVKGLKEVGHLQSQSVILQGTLICHLKLIMLINPNKDIYLTYSLLHSKEDKPQKTYFENCISGFQAYQQHKVRNFSFFLPKFFVFRKLLQTFHVILLSKISVNNSQKPSPASCIKKSAQVSQGKSR